MEQKEMDPLHGHILCLEHARRFKPRRVGVHFSFIPPEFLPQSLVCGRCAPHKLVPGGIMLSEQSLKAGVVTFMKNAAFDIRSVAAKALPSMKLKEGGEDSM